MHRGLFRNNPRTTGTTLNEHVNEKRGYVFVSHERVTPRKTESHLPEAQKEKVNKKHKKERRKILYTEGIKGYASN